MIPSELQRRIAERYEQLSPKQRRVARFIADNEAFTAFASAGELGKAVDVDAATVVRLAQSLGFSGYVELQEQIRGRIPERLTFVQRVEQQMRQPADRQQLPAQVFANDIDNLKDTLAQTQPESIAAVAKAIRQAEQVFVVGMGFSAATAVFLAHGLSSLGVRTTLQTAGGADLTIMLANLRPTDLLIGVSVWRYLRETLDAFDVAAAHGVPSVVFTDSSVSPPARIADHVLVAATQGVAHSLSPVGLVALVNLVLAQIVADEPDRTLASLREIDRLYRERRMVEGEEEPE